MKKLFLSIIILFAGEILFAQNEEGVVINGICWATRNLDVGGVFVANPEYYGALYQWGRKTDGHESRSSQSI
jgi:hypothetical protein